MTERWGLFGGTFDPIHWGHLLLAEITRSILSLHKVFFIPARIPPHKSNVRASSEQRYRMAQLACEGNPHFEVSDVEIRREGPSYTVDTLRTFRNRDAHAEIYLIIGADSAKDLGSWKDHETILEQSNVVVLGRPGAIGENISESLGSRVTILPTPLIELSSSDVRREVHEGRSIRYLVTDSVEKYIRSENLYGPGKDSV
jgi:nicotinate-nucleotide adenylyltransferase